MGNSKSMMWAGEPPRVTGRDVEALLLHCVDINASDITIQTDEPIAVEVYGKILKITKRRMSPSEINDIVGFLYQSESGLAKLNGGSDLDFAYEMRPERDKRLRFRVNATAISVQGHTGAQLTIRTIKGIPPDIKEMAVEPEILANFAPKQGLVLITGSTGSGKSTLLAGCLRWMAEDPLSNRKILTYEAPIEFVYDEIEKPSTIICQTEIGKHLKTFADGVRNALRRKPMVILVGEARDAETIGECVTASMTGHLTYSTVHSNGVADTIRRMVNVFPEGEKHARAIDIVTSLKMIVSQMLVPSTDGKRVALREYMVFNETIVDELLGAGVENMTQVSRQMVKKHGQTFLADATEKHKAGLIDKFEFNKIKALSKGMDRDVEAE
jgi:defect-in-organelle-trafficking protein DotB